MSFRFYTNAISQASRTIAAGIFIVGLVLIGFGFMIYLLPKFFATLAAVVFFVTGIGCGITAVKIFLAQRKLDQLNSDDSQRYRTNVQIHTEEYYDI
jgi:CHASE2 domain-containing sensor protein